MDSAARPANLAQLWSDGCEMTRAGAVREVFARTMLAFHAQVSRSGFAWRTRCALKGLVTDSHEDISTGSATLMTLVGKIG